jgi:hypothetical protein
VGETGGKEWCSEEESVRKGGVVDDQLGVCMALFLLNCWIAGCQVLLSKRLLG